MYAKRIYYFRILKSLFTAAAALLLLCMVSCEPLATSFDDTEDATYYTVAGPVSVPDTFSTVRVMTWNIRFGAGRILWFGDACGERVILTEDEEYGALRLIADRINLLKPDILLLQEVDIKSKRSLYVDQLQWLLDHTYFGYAVCGSQWKAQFIPSDGLGRMDEENVILSRWKISDAKRIQLALRNDQDKTTRYFYERCCMMTGRIEIPHYGNFFAVNIHASATAPLEIKQQHIARFKEELDRIAAGGGIFVAGGDLNTLPPGSDTTDYCIQDKCDWESFHTPDSDPLHKEGSNYEPEKHILDAVYTAYRSAVPTEVFHADQHRYFSHTTRPGHFWDRTLDYLFTNGQWADNTATTHQDATRESDHAPVSAIFSLPLIPGRK